MVMRGDTVETALLLMMRMHRSIIGWSGLCWMEVIMLRWKMRRKHTAEENPGMVEIRLIEGWRRRSFLESK